MSPIWQSLPMLHLLWLVPAFVLLFIYAGAARQRALRRFAKSEMLNRLLAKVSPARRRWKVLWLQRWRA